MYHLGQNFSTESFGSSQSQLGGEASVVMHAVNSWVTCGGAKDREPWAPEYAARICPAQSSVETWKAYHRLAQSWLKILHHLPERCSLVTY